MAVDPIFIMFSNEAAVFLDRFNTPAIWTLNFKEKRSCDAE